MEKYGKKIQLELDSGSNLMHEMSILLRGTSSICVCTLIKPMYRVQLFPTTQPRIHTGFHCFTEMGQIFMNDSKTISRGSTPPIPPKTLHL